MIFVAGINDRKKIIKEVSYKCKCNESKGIIILEERNFSLFFLPIFSWDKRYYLECKTCGSLYSIKKEYVDSILKEEEVFAYQLNVIFELKMCKKCGHELNFDYEYCPYCGNKIKE
ncbi:MAG: zinc ribbon domain-containing protein [Fusobacteriaceae bacterium]|nr:zinc ribbon domain-containing protein [Fusobacteriaceae bacterium]